jgi:hypothetical protein
MPASCISAQAQYIQGRQRCKLGRTIGAHGDPDRGHGARRGAKIITLAMTIGTRFPALQTSLGKVLLAWLPYGERERALAEPSRSGISPRWNQDAAETSIETLTERYLPLLLEIADKISAHWTLFRHYLQITVSTTACSNAPL